MRNVAVVRKALPALLIALVTAASATVWHNLPEPLAVYGPFDVNGTVGEQVTGRSIVMTVTRVRTGPQAQAAPRPPISAVGEWVVVDAELSATTIFVKPMAELRVGPNTYIPSERFLLTSLGSELEPGIRQRGSWVFDVAPALLDSGAPVALRVWQGDGRLDSRLVVEISMAGIRGNAPLDLQRVRVGT